MSIFGRSEQPKRQSRAFEDRVAALMEAGHTQDQALDIAELEEETFKPPVIVRAVRTCQACPSQWDAWDEHDRYWYLRYRGGVGTAEQLSGPDFERMKLHPDIMFQYGDMFDGSITLKKFCQLAGITLRLEKRRRPG